MPSTVISWQLFQAAPPWIIKKLGISLRSIQERASAFDLAALLQGDLYNGIAREVKHVINRYQDLPDQDKQFDLMISNSVFEHVSDIEDVLICARQNISTDGFIYTSIDFRDHRFYDSGQSPWQYLIDDSDYKPGYINKIRFTEMCTIIERAGFRIVECKATRESLSSEIYENILDKFSSLSKIDLETTEAQILISPL